MKAVLSQVSVLVLHYLFVIVSPISVVIDGQHGSDSLDCLFKGDTEPCYTLEFVSNHLARLEGSNVSIMIVSSSIVLKSVVRFTDVSNITIEGRYETVIQCNTTNTGGEAGIVFDNCFGIILQHFSIKHCGAIGNNSISNVDSHAILIMDSKDITVVDVFVANSNGYGLSLLDMNNSNILLKNCTFKENNSLFNKTDKRGSGGYRGGSGGLFIGINSVNIRGSYYKIMNCTFLRNKANPLQYHSTRKYWVHKSSHGGGMIIMLYSGSIGNIIIVNNCSYEENEAHFGAGLYIKCHSDCKNNLITFSHGTFVNNIATTGGGGMDIGYTIPQHKILHKHLTKHDIPTNNSIHFNNCVIRNNKGIFGGGVAIYTGTVLVFPKEKNTISFESCLFSNNRANGGAAVDINVANENDGFFFITVSYFKNCNFSHNTAGTSSNGTYSKITQSGAFFTSKVFAYFSGDIRFTNNIGTALYVSSTTISFHDATVTFENNQGGISGGIMLVGESYLDLKQKNNFTFQNNSGSFGGAMCAVILETHYFQYTDSCYIKHHNELNPYHNVFKFVNNTATTGIAHDIFISNLSPCRWKNCTTVTEVLQHPPCFATFEFQNESRSSYATATAKISVAKEEIYPIPGIPIELKISQIDQFNNSVGKIFPLSAVIDTSDHVTIDDNYAFVTEDTIVLNGNPNDTAVLKLQSNIIIVVMVSVSIQMADCPPGFYFNEIGLKCMCNLTKFITQCKTQRVALKQGHWAGYMHLNVDNSTKRAFGIGTCEYRLCVYDTNENTSLLSYGSYLLPSNSSLLNQFVCGSHREGTLCGKCKTNYTLYYNSPGLKCHKITDVCKYGILFYILSEIIPVTILFLVIIIFNIHLTSGSLYSFIFYAQTLDIMYVNAFGSLHFNGFVKTVFSGFQLFYGILNLKFTIAEKLSFCFIDRTITVMDVFLIQYSTVIYALFLIFATILILKVNSLYTCIKLCHKCGRRNIRGSVINGLTAFVVLCYFKCVDLTCSILIPIEINFLNDAKMQKPKRVPLFNGHLDYMKGDHLKYAISAIICLIVIILPPPILLMFESITMRLNRCFRIRRNCATYLLHRIRMKTLPFLDSFQGCFKDNCRCFAGLFFVYKVLLLSPFMYTGDIAYDYMSSLILLFGITILHAYCQPFQKPWHNTLDIILLIDLLLINVLTLNHYNSSMLGIESDSHLNELYKYLQLFCIVMPSIYLIVLLVCKIVIKFRLMSLIRNAIQNNSSESTVTHTFISNFDTEVIESDSLPFRLLQANSYHYDSFSTNNDDNR